MPGIAARSLVTSADGQRRWMVLQEALYGYMTEA